jgi:glycerol-3-phosphate acyltransferase PlsY
LTEIIYIIASAVFGYAAGSLPSGYLFVKLFHKKDITKEGSGNMGTLNAFNVSRSKTTTISVLIFDILKGVIPVYLVNYLTMHDMISIYAVSIFIILGHNYPVWLKFKGGRGLASATGVFAVINFAVIASWCVVWLIVNIIKKDILFSNFAATASLPFLVILLRPFLSNTFSILFSVNEYNYIYFIIFVFIITILILIKHGEIFSGKNKE